MMYDFTYYNPTKIYFGKDALENLPAELEQYGKTVLLVYGKGSVKKLGLYDQVLDMLQQAGKTVVELPGIQSNPTYAQLQEGGQAGPETPGRFDSGSGRRFRHRLLQGHLGVRLL